MKLTVYEVIPEGEKPMYVRHYKTTEPSIISLSIYLPTYLPTHLPLPTYLSTYLPIYLPTYIYLPPIISPMIAGNKNGRVSYYSLRRAYSHELGGVEGRHFTAYNMMTGSFGAGGCRYLCLSYGCKDRDRER